MKPSDLQRFVRDALARDELLSGCGCRVSLMDDGNFVSSLEKAMGLGGSGIHAVVSTPTFRPKSSAAKNVVGEIRIRVAVTEVPNLNRKRPGAVGGADAAWRGPEGRRSRGARRPPSAGWQEGRWAGLGRRPARRARG